MHLSFAEIRARNAPLRAADAVALVRAVAQEAGRRGADSRPAGLPDASQILLSGSGRVWFAEGAAEAGDRDYVSALAALLQDLLGLDDRADGEPRGELPGALLVLVARSLNQIDLPRPSFAEFQESLARFGSADTVTLASIYRRVAGRAGAREVSPDPRTAPVVAMPPVSTPVEERRLTGPRVSDLRRDLRDAELQLFAAAQDRHGFNRRSLARRVAVAAVVLAASGIAAIIEVNERFVTQVPGDVASVANAVQPIPPAAPPGDGSLGERSNLPDVTPRPDSEQTMVAPVERDTPIENPRRVLTSDAQAKPSPQEISISPVITARTIGADLFSPSFAGREGELLFHAGRDRAALMRAAFDEDGRPVTATLLQDGAANYHATLSPDGKWLAFDSDREGTRGVYVARADASDARRVSGEGYAAVPRWSPDGRRLAFIKSEPRRSRVWNVWVADLAAGTLARVSRHRVGQAWGASLFPDGERLAYSVEDTLVIARVHGDGKRVIRSPVAGRLIRTPAVSPDGQWILFQVYRDGAWLLDVSTGAMRRVLADRAAEEFAWSSDSRRVVYHTRRNGAYSLWQLALDDPQALVNPPG